MLILGLDFGGTKLAAGLYDTSAGVLLARTQCPTPLAGGAIASRAAMLLLARDLLAAHTGTLAAVGVSFGGPVAPDGRVVRLSMHVPGWEQAALADWLEQELAVDARIANDGDAAAMAEHRLGAGQGVQTLLYVTASTGIGGGVIIANTLHRGQRGWAGEVGHMVLDPNGPPCPCGRNGCLEALASGLSIARDARIALDSDANASILRTLPRAELSARHVAEAAAQGDTIAHMVWQRAMAWIGIGLGSAANLLNPGRIVVGGGLTRAGDLFFEPVRRGASQRAMDPELSIVPAQLGNDVGILGGVSLWL
ncbi:MAG: ROK family protein [Roseiflexaceae bacterium]|nr:ROK family protein [Roseiflexaceae bacterium]